MPQLFIDLISNFIFWVDCTLIQGFCSFLGDADSLDEENHRGRRSHCGPVGSHAVRSKSLVSSSRYLNILSGLNWS